MREIVLDTETTGLNPTSGHRVVEIGAVEICNLIPTGRSFHVYLDPERDMPEDAFKVHGLSGAFLAGQKKFSEIAGRLLDFFEDSQLVIHNAEFDIRFLNAELTLADLPCIGMERAIDTLAMARRRHPGAPNSLDALCARYRIDTSRREKHGALLDASLLAEVYAELMGGRQAAFSLQSVGVATVNAGGDLLRHRHQPLAGRLTPAELEAHRNLVSGLGKTPIWKRYESDE
ncbi:MAG: DNA polymerase III subunit epsilon [Methylocystis sp.]|nr:DNA polymerase III subunit epsilon [Methylocystis sp.]